VDRGREEGVLDVERWAELRREHFVRGVPIKELVRRTGLSRNTVRAALRSTDPPVFRVPERPSKLDPFKDEIHRLLKADPQAKGAVERLQGYVETNFEPGRRFANHLDFQCQLDAWFAKANARTHKTLRERPIDRLVEEREVMRPLPAREPDLDRRWVTRVAPDPHVRFDTNDYSLDPNLVGRRVEVRVSQREIIAVARDTGELAARHERCFAKNKTITALEHARTLRERRGQPGVDELIVEQRPLSVYDQLIA
jgi:Mu transposase-like protein